MDNNKKRKNYKTLKLIFVLLIMPVLLIGLFFVTKVTPAVVNGEVTLQSTADKTVYLFGEWRMQPMHVLPENYNFSESQIIKVNRDTVPDGLKNYSLSANVRGFDASRYSLCLYNIAFVGRIYVGDTIVYSESDETRPYYNIVDLEGLVEGDDFTITVWMTNISDRQKSFNPLALSLAPSDVAYQQSLGRVILKYSLEGIYIAFSVLCAILYIKSKSSIQFLLLALSGLIRLLALESYLAPTLLLDWLSLSPAWSVRISIVLVALACTINVGMIYVLYKNTISKRLIFVMLFIVNLILVLTLIFGLAFGLLLNISGMLLYFISFVSVGRAWWRDHKTAGPVFAAFWFYLLSAPFFSSARILSGMGSVLGIYNFVCPFGELLFYIVTLFAFFVRYTDSYIKSLSQIELMGLQLNDKDRSLSEAYEKLSDFEAARTRIFRDLTHDLRTPITSVLGYLSMISEGEIVQPEEVKSISGRMLLRIRQIKEMINSISGLTNIEQGQLKMHIKPCPVSDILNTVLLHYEQKCSDAGIIFNVNLGISAYVLADIQQITRVFDNLISNAIRYTPEGGSIKVEAYTEGKMVRFSVSDTGCGIAKDKLPYVFERFYRAEPSRSDTYMHQGLGLAICYEIIKAHGGEISAESDAQTGSRFSFTLIRSPKEQ